VYLFVEYCVGCGYRVRLFAYAVDVLYVDGCWVLVLWVYWLVVLLILYVVYVVGVVRGYDCVFDDVVYEL